MQFYLDDCAYSKHLVGLLQHAGHTVLTPRTEHTMGTDDPRHLAHAVAHGCALITKNPDFTLKSSRFHLPFISGEYSNPGSRFRQRGLGPVSSLDPQSQAGAGVVISRNHGRSEPARIRKED